MVGNDETENLSDEIAENINIEPISPPKSAFTVSADFECLEIFYKNNVDLYLCYCGIENCSKGHSFGPAIRKEYLIHYILSGKGTYQVGDKTYTVQAGEYFLICPNQTTFYQADEEDPWSYIWIGFQGIKASMYIDYLHLDEKEKLIGKCENADYLKSLILEMLEARTLTFTNELKREGLLYLFLSELINALESDETMMDKNKYPQQMYVEHVLNYIERNYCNEIRVSQLAKEMGLSRSYLSSCFKKQLGETVQEYLMRFRMEKAATLLVTETDSIGLIAGKVGYEDQLAFSKTFRKKYGMSPSEYRQKYKGNEDELQIQYRF